MQGTIKDDGSRRAGPREYRVQFKSSLRLTLADRRSKAGGPSLFAAGWTENHFSNGICRTIRAVTRRILRGLGIGGLAAVLLVVLAGKVNAYIMPNEQIRLGYNTANKSLGGYLSGRKQHSIRGQLNFSRGRRDLNGYYLMAYHSPWWAEGNFNEGDNIEWIYDNLENQYTFLDVTLYKLIGGNYLLGPPCYPSWHGFRDFYWEKDSAKKVIYFPEDKVSPQWMDICGKFSFFGEPAEPGDQLSAYIGEMIVGQHIVSDEGWYNLRIFRDSSLTAYIDGAMPGDMMTFAAWSQRTGKIYPVEILLGVPTWTFHGDSIRVDVNTIPEPSSIVLFGFVALKVLLFRRVYHRVQVRHV